MDIFESRKPKVGFTGNQILGVEIATRKAVCQTCQEPILKGDLRMYAKDSRGGHPWFHHVRCVVIVLLKGIEFQVIRNN